jgi:uncharacterized protein involved in exopolysaccharide biosynthesis
MSYNSSKPFHEYQLMDLFRVWTVSKKQIIWTTIAAACISIAVSLIVPEYFESRTILYPISMTTTDRNMIFGQQQGGSDLSYFGNKYDASRILQVSQSAEVIDFIIHKYNLKNHYKYKADEKYINTKVKEEFLDNYHAIKNDKDAIEITLLDTDKDTCAMMVNDIALKIDEIATRPVIEGKEKIIHMLKIELAKKQAEQSAAPSANITEEIKTLSETLTQYNVSNNEKISSITILEKAYPAEKKSKPVRWILVLVSTILALFFALFLTVILSQVNYIRENI